jgi:hypothetical protein
MPNLRKDQSAARSKDLLFGHDAYKPERLDKHIPAEMNTHATIEEPVSKQQIDKHTTIEVLLECFLFDPCKVVIKNSSAENRHREKPVWRRGRIPPPWPCES